MVVVFKKNLMVISGFVRQSVNAVLRVILNEKKIHILLI